MSWKGFNRNFIKAWKLRVKIRKRVYSLVLCNFVHQGLGLVQLVGGKKPVDQGVQGRRRVRRFIFTEELKRVPPSICNAETQDEALFGLPIQELTVRLECSAKALQLGHIIHFIPAKVGELEELGQGGCVDLLPFSLHLLDVQLAHLIVSN